ncbi:MAG: hypothetical protein ACODAE_01420 [Gemmatimonadota bacterium]
MRRPQLLLFWILVAAAPAGCGLPFFERWAGDDVVRRPVNAPAATVWSHVRRRVEDLGLVTERVRAADRTIQLGWITPPGDGRLYLRCDHGRKIGSASLRSRIRVRAADGGAASAVVIGSEARATGGRTCVSTGRFEDWLAKRLEPAMVAAEEGSDRRSDRPVAPATAPGSRDPK